MDNPEGMDKFLETYSLTKLNQEETDNLNRPITRSKIRSVIFLKVPANNSPDWTASLGNSTKHTKKNLYFLNFLNSFLNSSKRLKRREHSQSHSMKPPSP